MIDEGSKIMEGRYNRLVRCPFSGKARTMTTEQRLTLAQISSEELNNINNVEYWYQKGLKAVSPFEKIDPVTGFIPSNPPLTELPTTHEVWDILASKLPELMRTNSVTEYLAQMPCLSAMNLPEEFIYRASVIIGSAAHAYAYAENAYCQQTFHLTPSSAKAKERKLPISLERPYQELTQRLNRAYPQALIYEFSLYNWKFKTGSQPKFNCNNLTKCLDNLELLVPIFGSEVERRFILNFFMTELLAGPCAGLIVEVFRCVKADKQDKLCSVLLEIGDHLKRCNLMLKSNIPLNENHHNYFNSSLWSKTVAPLWAEARHGEVGISGGASPFFIMLDNLIARDQYEGNLGGQIINKGKDNPLSFTHRHFLNSIRKIQLKTYITQSKNPRLNHAFIELCRLYNGDQGYHAIHRNIVMGYMLVGTACGRGNTNSGTLKWHDNNAVLQLDEAFEGSKQERDLGIDANKRTFKCHLVKSRKIGNNTKELVFDVKDKIFRIYPGDKVSVIPKNESSRVDFALEKCKNYNFDDFKLDKWWHSFFHFNDIDIDNHSPQFIINKILTYGDLSSFDSSNKQNISDIGKIINSLRPLSLRLYSISSSQYELDKNAELRLTVGLLEYKNKNKINFGICSRYLFNLEEQETVNFYLIRSNWNIPLQDQSSLVMIAGGTGISPVMALLRNRPSLEKSNNILFFVTKDVNNFYYKDEIDKFVQLGNLSFYGAFTRDCQYEAKNLISSKNDIHHLLIENRNLIIEQIKNGAYFFVCGKMGFGQTVRSTIKEINNTSEQKMCSMIANGRYIEELFTTHQDEKLSVIDEIDVIVNPDYFVIDNNVYDISAYKYEHPGGAELFLSATEEHYKRQHGNCPHVNNILQSLHIGRVKSRSIKDFALHQRDFYHQLKDLLKVSCSSLKKIISTTNIQGKDANTIILYELAYMTLDVYLRPIILIVMSIDTISKSEQNNSIISIKNLLNYLNVDKDDYDRYLERIKNLKQEYIYYIWSTLKEAGINLLITIRDITKFYLDNLTDKDVFGFTTEIKKECNLYFNRLYSNPEWDVTSDQLKPSYSKDHNAEIATTYLGSSV
ncbi:MAG: hypothetical protein F6K47_06925 [Symploca sp. SIO2E6]|nr:hypothetical protein [Symploca sp. SIO2E6]